MQPDRVNIRTCFLCAVPFKISEKYPQPLAFQSEVQWNLSLTPSWKHISAESCFRWWRRSVCLYSSALWLSAQRSQAADYSDKQVSGRKAHSWPRHLEEAVAAGKSLQQHVVSLKRGLQQALMSRCSGVAERWYAAL